MTKPTILTSEMADWTETMLRAAGRLPHENGQVKTALESVRDGRTLVITAERDKLDAEAWALLVDMAKPRMVSALGTDMLFEKARALIAKREGLKP